jgi:hypothetical protein
MSDRTTSGRLKAILTLPVLCEQTVIGHTCADFEPPSEGWRVYFVLRPTPAGSDLFAAVSPADGPVVTCTVAGRETRIRIRSFLLVDTGHYHIYGDVEPAVAAVP